MNKNTTLSPLCERFGLSEHAHFYDMYLGQVPTTCPASCAEQIAVCATVCRAVFHAMPWCADLVQLLWPKFVESTNGVLMVHNGTVVTWTAPGGTCAIDLATLQYVSTPTESPLVATVVNLQKVKP